MPTNAQIDYLKTLTGDEYETIHRIMMSRDDWNRRSVSNVIAAYCKRRALRNNASMMAHEHIEAVKEGAEQWK